MIFAALGVFAGLSLNMVLNFALGAAGLVRSKNEELSPPVPVVQIFCLFLSSLIFWIAYYYVFHLFQGGFLEYFLVFPLSSLVCSGVETLIRKIAPRKKIVKVFSALNGYDGLAPVSFLLTCKLAMNLSDGLFLSFFFAAGCLAAAAIIAEIRRRASLEWVPAGLRGAPLALISMGLLSMVSAGITGICFKMLEFF